MPRTPILVLNKITGIGGEVESPDAVHVHFQPYAEINGRMSESTPLDTLYLRHLSIYILNKYFVKIKDSQHQHIPMPLGEIFKFGASIGVLSERVYGYENSSFYNEHLDWKPVEAAFAKFGFPDLAADFMVFPSDGFEYSRPHNHFNQDSLYPEEEKVFYQKVPGKRSLEDRFATSRWMRIDFETLSFTFEEKKFINSIDQNQESLQAHLSDDENHFLLGYKKIVANEQLEKMDDFQQCIFRIRQSNLCEVYERQLDFVRRCAVGPLMKINSYHPEYVACFLQLLNQMPDNLMKLRTMVDTDLYRTPADMDACVYIAMELLSNNYSTAPSNVKMFFSHTPSVQPVTTPQKIECETSALLLPPPLSRGGSLNC